MADLSNESQSRLLETERTFHSKLDAARAEHKQQEDKLKADLESLRQQKDAKIRQGEREREEQRNAYELKINGLDNQIKSKSCRQLI